MTGSLHLPVPGRLARTGPVDFVEHYYSGGAGWIMRQRLRWVRDALPESCERVLEIGYGSGIFAYELARRARLIVGIDVHTAGASVRRQCAADGVPFTAAQASGMTLPFADASFDAVVIVSALEFMSDPLACLQESLRVVRPGGRVVAVTPRVLRWADAVWRVLFGVDPECDFRGGRQRVALALADPSVRVAHHPRPWPLPNGLAPYDLVVLAAGGKRNDSHAFREAIHGARSDEYVDRGRLVDAELIHRHRKHHGPAFS
jgi:SAM-dependent methyltransferase